MVILKCLAIIFTFLYLTTHQICFLNYNISYPVDLRFDLPNTRQFTYHCENLEWITGCSLINICFHKLLAFQIKRKIPSWPYGFKLEKELQIKFFDGSCVCCNHAFCTDMIAKTRHRVMLMSIGHTHNDVIMQISAQRSLVLVVKIKIQNGVCCRKHLRLKKGIQSGFRSE